ncbi:conserved hypothetical protein [Leishmania mexicana MHOM/GT/2001/U1103]|uniref:Presenilin enhancer-2 subunit of gamma secretase n=1 Tax=Leishmania mexicana (strain MHOM/GT/2001/U1103) TaxID=929439 RepID=E9B438_LEIMU|nr:conserved hypothetical protein [Leishmania mexicana MHOM/GT/2001/U1103]CBZ30006.1 conserved hypothetical protein [Leishmania mexicana MHOM/GT/2001/U1103]
MLVRGAFTLGKAENACQWYYRIGFFGLPWLWAVLWLFFRHYEDESELIRWYVERARRYSILGGAVFVIVSVAFLFVIPPTSPIWVIAPFQDTFQWGYFAVNASEVAGAQNTSSSG